MSRYESEEAALKALRAPGDLAAGVFTDESGDPVVVRVARREGELDVILDDGGEARARHHLAPPLTSQEWVLVQRHRKMPVERQLTFRALAEALAAAPADASIYSVLREVSAGMEADSGHEDFRLRKAASDWVRARER